ncbi:uncharacterized protein MELLADRAFT_68057 [Melampsora larici-populina 98AG31]|uniref:CYRIA/CYRIB Rac1 binding domain-containing protein n=1 Tax=Melampsora larici-populina (strain 98AG31 / pathotype 3-4-7) TaxID=747676 RepID=F4S5F3_MELLP|nr:uncharacterized protein MELLADRAFT_68057 [Melampsora larici-populina 98AG31]EGG00172.1 hypothetical protein MELLADRAFT_68057 [Melampsora larici-populina 98AG31]
MPPKKSSKKTEASAHPFRHTRVTRASQALSQANNTQPTQSDTPPSPQPKAIVGLRPKRGQKRSFLDQDEFSEASGSITGRKRSKVNPALSQIPSQKPRGRPKRALTLSQFSPPLQSSSRIPIDKKGKGKSKQALSRYSSEDLNPAPNRSPDIQINVIPDLSSDEYPARLDAISKSSKKAHEPLESEDVLHAVRMRISLLQPTEARKEIFELTKNSDAKLHRLHDELETLTTCINEIKRAISTIKSAQKELAWTTVLEVIETMENMLSNGTHLQSPATNTTDQEVQLPVEWRLWKSEALVYLGEVQTAKEIFPRQAESIDKYYRYRVKGLIEFAEHSYQEALISFDQAANRLSLSHSKEMDRRDGEVLYLMERAKELQRRKNKLLTVLRKRSEPKETYKALKWIPRIMADSDESLESPFRLILREIQCDLSTLHETFEDDGLSDLRAYIQEQKIEMGGFRFDRRNNLPISHRSHILSIYFYLARAESYGDDFIMSKHHFDMLDRLEKEGWGPLGIMGADRFDPKINDPDPASRLPTPELQETSFESEGPPPAQKIKTFKDYKGYYATLNLTSGAEYDEIKRSYKKLSKSESSNAKILSDELNMMKSVGIPTRQTHLAKLACDLVKWD